MKITHKNLVAVLRYVPSSGIWIWRTAKGPMIQVGQKAGSVHSSEYVHIKIDNRLYKAHRLAWFYVTKRWPTKDVEHKNTDRGDNRWCNLRLANDSQNQANARRRKDNTSGFKSVYFRKDSKKWRASLQVRGVRRSLGSFGSRELAHAAYLAAAKKHFGEFARGH